MLLKATAVVAAAVALSACGGSTKRAVPKSNLPPGCTVTEVDQVVRDFLTQPSLAPKGMFEVYASYESDGRTFIARTRAKALAHLQQRAALGEASRLIELRVATQDFNHVRITFQLTRHAPDFASRKIHQRLVKGGGTVDCAHQKIAAWVTKGP